MANEETALFNFYRRYRWREVDFSLLQQTLIDAIRGVYEGTYGSAVLSGLGFTSASGLNVTVGAGIAVNNIGRMLVVNTPSVVAVTVPGSGLQSRSLVVLRPVEEDGTMIVRPTSPNDEVPLKTIQKAQVVIISGTAGTAPVYPSKAAGDVILFGIRAADGDVTITQAQLDFEVREIMGSNSEFQQNNSKYDDRLRPYRSGTTSVGIKPSQLFGNRPRAFSFVNRTAPSIFPKNSSGEFNPADTFLNMTTGVISGGDEESPNFTPEVPSAGNAIVAAVGLSVEDELVVDYGEEGTRAECRDGVINQKSVGDGSVSIPLGTKLICFIVCYSHDGVSVTEIDVIDARGVAAVGELKAGVAGGLVVSPGAYPLSITHDDDGNVFLIDSSEERTINLPAHLSGFKVTIKDVGGLAETNPITLVRDGAAGNIEGLDEDMELTGSYGSWTLISTGTDWEII